MVPKAGRGWRFICIPLIAGAAWPVNKEVENNTHAVMSLSTDATNSAQSKICFPEV